MTYHQLRLVGVDGFLDFGKLVAAQRLDGEQRIDEQAVAERRWHASGRGVRAGDETHFLQVRHHIADSGRREFQAGVFRQSARADRLTFRNVAFDQGLEQGLRAVVEHVPIVFISADRWQMAGGGEFSRGPGGKKSATPASFACLRYGLINP